MSALESFSVGIAIGLLLGVMAGLTLALLDPSRTD